MNFERFYPASLPVEDLRAAVVRRWTEAGLDVANPRHIDIGVAMLQQQQSRWEHYRNETYHAIVDRSAEHGMGPQVTLWHVLVSRHDGQPIHDWRDMQAIKTALLGAEVEAVELFPSESRVVDTANVFHLWAFPGKALPFGFAAGMRADETHFGVEQRAGSRATCP